MSSAIEAEWESLTPVRVGGLPEHVATPDRHVSVLHDDDMLLRVELYSYGSDCFAFESTLIWRGNLAVGFGSHVHLVSLSDRSVTTLALGSYFGHLYLTEEYLLVASGERVFRIDPNRQVLWTSEVLGIDGVLLSDVGPPIIRGEGEWDPPGGWAPFQLLAESGRRTQLNG